MSVFRDKRFRTVLAYFSPEKCGRRILRDGRNHEMHFVWSLENRSATS